MNCATKHIVRTVHNPHMGYGIVVDPPTGTMVDVDGWIPDICDADLVAARVAHAHGWALELYDDPDRRFADHLLDRLEMGDDIAEQRFAGVP